MSINKSDLIAVRDRLPNDESFILATWLRGLKYGNEWFSLIDPKAYFSIYDRVIKNIIDRPNITIKVACLKEDPEVILGYCVYENDRLDWVFVKKAWRKIGICKQLLPKNLKTVSHLTTVGKSILLGKYKNVTFNPFFQ